VIAASLADRRGLRLDHRAPRRLPPLAQDEAGAEVRDRHRQQRLGADEADAIHTARRPPMTALKRMFEKVHSAVPPIMHTAVKLTALPEVTSASRMERSRSLLTRISSMMRERM